MGITQRYKQTQRQARVQTSEGSYINGMHTTDNPLSEGQSRLLVNFDIDPQTGKLVTRKGYQSVGVVTTPITIHGEGTDYSRPAPTALAAAKNCSVIDTNNRITKNILQLIFCTNLTTNSHRIWDVVSIDTETNTILADVTGYAGISSGGIPGGGSNYRVPKFHSYTLNPGLLHKKPFYKTDFFTKIVGTFINNQFFTLGKAHVDYTGSTTNTPDIAPDPNAPVVVSGGGYDGHALGNVVMYTKQKKELSAGENVSTLDPTSTSISDEAFGIAYTRPKIVTPTEAVSYGYNMLLDYPYSFGNKRTNTNVFSIKGILLYEDTALTKPATLCRVGANYTAKAFYSAPKTYTNHNSANTAHFKWEYKEPGAASWTTLKDELITISSESVSLETNFSCAIQIPAEDTIVRITITDPTNVITTDTGTEEYQLASLFTTVQAVASDELYNKLNMAPKNYDLTTCRGMCYWQHRTVLWGVQDAENIIFVSDLDNPGYYPYPNNVDTFNDPVLGCYNYGNDLLVLTTRELYRLVWTTDGTTWNTKLVQHNLNITELDAHIACVIHNMFMFKSGEYYYMLVPRAGTASGTNMVGDIAIAPISKPIYALLDNFHSEISELINTMYGGAVRNDFTDRLVDYYSEIDNDKIRINYVYDISPDDSAAGVLDSEVLGDYTYVNRIRNTKYLYVQLVYDTALRAWTIEVFETPAKMYVPLKNAVGQTDYINLITDTADPKGGSGWYDTAHVVGRYYIQYIKKQGHTDNMYQCKTGTNPYWGGGNAQGFLPDISEGYYDENNNPVPWTPEQIAQLIEQYKDYVIYYGIAENASFIEPPVKQIYNYSYLDTGNRDINTDMKKRFREYQFKIKNPDGVTALKFYTGFYIDGSLRRDISHMDTVIDTSSGENVIVVNRTLDEDAAVYTNTADKIILTAKQLQDAGELYPTELNNGIIDMSTWTIDLSAFPGRTLWKIRMAIAGKGLSPRAIILSKNDRPLEILGQSWVYRTQNSR